MTARTTSKSAALTALAASLLLAGAASAQTAEHQDGSPETPAQARARAATSSLNGAPADTVLRPRPNAQPPLTDAERPRPQTPVRAPAQVPAQPPAPSQTQAPARTPAVAQSAPPPAATTRPTQTRPQIAAPAQSQAQAQTRSGSRTQTAPAQAAPVQTGPAAGTTTGPRGPSITLAAGQTTPTPIAMPLGYYVRGDKNCDQVWPREGDLAWFTPTSFTIDFGGCEPGQFLQTGPNSWSEEQHCMTELGGDAGTYKVTYEVIGVGTVMRNAHLAIDDHFEEDVWKHCEAADVPIEARFKS